MVFNISIDPFQYILCVLVNLTEFEDGEDKRHLPLPEEMVAGEAKHASGTEDDHLVDVVLLNRMMHLAASTAPID